jgi:hypothetical protein
VRSNPSLHPTCYSGLRPPPQAGELKRYGDMVASMVASMNGRAVPVSAFVQRWKPSPIERCGQWFAARASARAARQSRALLLQRFQVPSFSAGPRCCVGARQRWSRKARIGERASPPPFGSLRHNLAAHADARGSAGAMQRSSRARRWPPR